jgi:hypothetical protein
LVILAVFNLHDGCWTFAPKVGQSFGNPRRKWLLVIAKRRHFARNKVGRADVYRRDR